MICAFAHNFPECSCHAGGSSDIADLVDRVNDIALKYAARGDHETARLLLTILEKVPVCEGGGSINDLDYKEWLHGNDLS